MSASLTFFARAARVLGPAALLLAPWLGGCGDDPPSFEKERVDAAIECTSPGMGGGGAGDAGPVPDGAAMDASPPPSAAEGEEIPCPAGQVCLQGRCYAGCANDLDCSQAEQCDEGVCTPRTRPRPDGGDPPDSGPSNPCEGVTCESPTPACHPVGGGCVSCLDISQCTPGNVCDVGRGVCRGFSPRPCSPCDTDVQCMDSAGVSVGSCTMLDDDFERVCVPSCTMAEDCPTGLECQDGRCLPRVGTCTGFLAAVEGRACSADDECVPFGSVAAEGQCEMTTTDAGTFGVCLQPCGVPTDCPAGTTCMDGFCRPSA